jgi:hypothetical protein
MYSTLTALAAAIEARGDVDGVWNEALGVLGGFAVEDLSQDPRNARERNLSGEGT